MKFATLSAIMSSASANWLTDLMSNSEDPYMPYPGHFELPLEVRKREEGDILPGMSHLLLEQSTA